MHVLVQISLGSAVLLLCAVTHMYVGAALITHLRRTNPLTDQPTTWTFVKTISIIFLAMLFSHTLHIYYWATSLWLMSALQGYEEPLYFSLVTYTTLGYGDITLAKEFRIFGAMASVCGILMFGLTTAFLVGFLTKLLQRSRY